MNSWSNWHLVLSIYKLNSHQVQKFDYAGKDYNQPSRWHTYPPQDRLYYFLGQVVLFLILKLTGSNFLKNLI